MTGTGGHTGGVRPTLAFDGDCGFCTSSARWLARRLPDDVDVVPWQRADLPALGITEAQAAAAVQWVDGDGRVGGAAAIGRALHAAGGPWRPLGWLAQVPPTGWVAEGLYRLVSRNRHRLPGGTPACRLDAPR